MKITVMYAGQATPHVGWLAVDEFAELLAHYADATLVSPRPIQQGRIANRLLGRNRFEPVESAGGDILVVVARSASDLNMAKSIADYRKKFAKMYGVITDSYHKPGYMDITSEYDGIFVTALEDVDFVKSKYKTSVHHMYQGIDTLRWGPSDCGSRGIDIVGFGRMPSKYQEQLINTFHPPESPYLYLHSPLGNVTGPTITRERGMLFKLLQRTKISLAFNLFVGADGNRPISMMVTSRWLESSLSGCIVMGKRPVSRMADDMLFWENATIELSDDVNLAMEQLKATLNHDNKYADQRKHNIYHVMNKHDWRYRLKDMSNICGIEFNKKFDTDLLLLDVKCKAWVQE